VLAGGPLATELREQVIEDTLAGAPGAKQAWTERGMIEDVSGRLAQVMVPVIVVVVIVTKLSMRVRFGKSLPVFFPKRPSGS
jgi:hypothetical protein